MIDQRKLIQEIPAEKFHSVLMTSFSINLYYWEIQLLRTLSGKGIDYVSAVVDSECLSDQLLKFSKAFSSKKPLNFSLHGYKSKGAFHPKIQFYAGKNTVLVLIGSGNLTISGHGRNMEVWTPIMVDSEESGAFPFIRDVWNYLKSLYIELGEEAYKIIQAVESNCKLLIGDYTSTNTEHQIDSDCTIRLFVDSEKKLFSQCQEWIGQERIKSITVMSPFYDNRGELIKALYNQYHPKWINMIVEKGFGSLPYSKYIPNYVRIYNWEKAVPAGKKYQHFFHSKCYFFEGELHHYLLCGSANASVAAFGTPKADSTNREACVGYKSASTDFFAESGLLLTEPMPKSEISHDDTTSNESADSHSIIWIKEAYYEYDRYVVKTENDTDIDRATITFYSGDRQQLAFYKYKAKAGESIISGTFHNSLYPLYVEITNKSGLLISNRQFVIPAVSMETNDPSEINVNYRRRCHDIESGNFINGTVLKFIEQVLSDKGTNKSAKISSKGASEGKPKNEKGNPFSSYNEYIKDDGTGITGDVRARKQQALSHSTLLFDSMLSYIGKSAKEKEEQEMDDEEMEDIRKSEGKERKSNPPKPLKPKTAEDVKKRVKAMLDKYIERLKEIALCDPPKTKTILLKDSMERFMTAVFFIYRTLSYRFVIEDSPEKEQTLLNLKYSIYNHKTAIEYLYRIINLFALCLMKSKIQEDANRIVREKVNGYKQYAFELCLTAMSICDWLNKGQKDYNVVSSLKESSLRNIQKAFDGKVSENTVTNVFRLMDKDTQELEGFDKTQMESIINNLLSILNKEIKLYPESNLVWTKEFGYVSLLPKGSQNVFALPCTMVCSYDYKLHTHCPEYHFNFSKMKLLKILKSNPK